jgi:hypothetical protein
MADIKFLITRELGTLGDVSKGWQKRSIWSAEIIARPNCIYGTGDRGMKEWARGLP